VLYSGKGATGTCERPVCSVKEDTEMSGLRNAKQKGRALLSLLFLVGGLVALLWRALPVYSWIPNYCLPGDTHRMEPGNVAYWGGSRMGDGMLGCDRWKLIYYSGGWWYEMPLNGAYGYYTPMRFQTYTTGPTHNVCHDYEFGVELWSVVHRNRTVATYTHYCGSWTCVREMCGYQLDMTRS
jgi:hypothetical protein